MREKKSSLLAWVILGGGGVLFLTVSFLALVLFFFSDGSSLSLSFPFEQVAVLELEGIIFDSKEFNDQLKDYGNRPAVKAIVLRINSPGGGVAASQEIYEAVKRIRATTNKKVIVSMASVAASGGYYVACASDKIYANPGTITGSIGVIAEWYNYADLLHWAKLQSIIFKSGELKDAGSPTRPLTEQEKLFFQNLINSMHNQFVTAVVEGRKMKEEKVRKLADGRVYTGIEAKTNGLVDEVVTLQDAIASAARGAGISGEPKTISPVKKRTSLLDLLGSSKRALSLNPDSSESHIRFEYLWR
jgi:protease-4